MENSNKLSEPDYVLFVLASTLVIVGVVFSYSLSVYTVLLFDYNDFHFFIRQLIYAFIGIGIMYFFLNADPYKYVKGVGKWFFLIFFTLIVLMPFMPDFLVTESGGAKRWIKFPGISISPVEFFKIGFIYFLASSFNRNIIGKNTATKLVEEYILFFPYFLIFVIVLVFVAYFQKDLGQSMLMAMILITFIIFTNQSKKLIMSLFLAGVVGFVVLIAVAGHRIKRIAEWWAMHQESVLGLFPDSIQKQLTVVGYEEPYQVGHSLNAIANGGLTGEGVGNGFLKMGFLSEVHTDFVLAGIAEEAGWLGIIFVLALLLAISWRIFKISNRVKENVFHFFTLGVAVMIMGAFFINSFGISGVIPIKGIAVPFLSYGGSSIIASCVGIGLVLSISRANIKTINEENNIEKM